ncbi:ABC transporter ATP-binding protein [Conexibacter woesei]|uniref:ABC transporter related protein n=1 Tax=Conexibacter woesei (strain DSM 14684 / CCUG 47730 / CIP 108061 / JCM 11494 / NBRC 100937 / ID131577) TaxID=469383 RepID=D3F733_CONWI|nr:ATP-binding cassette domain-containing protein [Conexibacter woesei]ADB48804.1 ABC transporter related protein [Conexibacter woesei DSM 14684]
MLPSTIISAVGVTRTHGAGDEAVHALDGVSVDVPAGRLTAISGSPGAGKTTLAHLLGGLDRPTAGSIEVDGIELTALDDDDLAALRRDLFGYVFRAPNLLPVLTVDENVLAPQWVAGRRPGRRRLELSIELAGLGAHRRLLPAQLTGVQQQRVAVARALLGEPAVVFADEPAGDLDEDDAAELLGLLRRVVDELGQTVVLLTRDARAAAALAHRVVTLDGGRRSMCVAPRVPGTRNLAHIGARAAAPGRRRRIRARTPPV